MLRKLGLIAILSAALTLTPLTAQRNWWYIGPPIYGPHGPYYPRYYSGYYPGPYPGFYYPGYTYPGPYPGWHYYHEHHEHNEDHHRHK